MPRLNSPAAAVLALLALAPVASAKIPSPALSQVDAVVVGDPAGSHAFRVALKDASGLPLWSEMATLDFSNAPVRLCSTQEAGVTLDCAHRTLTRITDHDGVAVFHPRFGGACNSPEVRVLGEGVIVALLPARSTDMDAVDGCTGLGDFGRFATLYLESATNHPEADFDGSGGAIGLGDFALFAHDLFAGSKDTYCP